MTLNSDRGVTHISTRSDVGGDPDVVGEVILCKSVRRPFSVGVNTLLGLDTEDKGNEGQRVAQDETTSTLP